MTLSDLSIRRPVFAWMLMAACIIFGAVAYSRLGVSMLPDFTRPILTINVTWPGAVPDVLENQVVVPIEQSVISVQGLKEIRSTIQQGTTRIRLEFYTGYDINAALQEVNSRVQGVALPDQVNPPTIIKVNTDDMPILWMSVTWDKPLHDLIEYVELNLQDQMTVIPGVGDVQLGGWSNRTMRVWVDNNKLKQYDLTILDVRDALQSNHTEIAGGYLEDPLRQANVRTMGEAKSVLEIGNIIINQRAGSAVSESPVRIRDVASVEDGLDDLRRYSRTDGKMSVGLGFRKQNNTDAVQVAENILQRADELRKDLPPGMDLNVSFDSSKFTKEAIHETEFTVILSILVTSLVCWAFLGNWSSTVNVLIAIPMSVIGTFIVMYFLNFTLNMFTLLGLSLAVGIVVDDSIMVLENIARHQRMGKGPIRAALDGAREITFAAMASTISVVAIFSPVLFIGGMVGTFLFQFGVVISVAVMLSLLEAITLTPMRCSQFASTQLHENRFTQWINTGFLWLAGWYRRILDWALNYRLLVVLVSVALFVASLLVFPQLKKELSPAQDVGMLTLRIQGKPTDSLEHTANAFNQVEDLLKSKPYVATVFTNVGGYSGGEVSTGSMFVNLVPRKQRPKQQVILAELRQEMKRFKDLNIQVNDPSQGAFSPNRGTTLEVSLRGPDYQVLNSKAQEIMQRMKDSGEFTDVDVDYREGAKQLNVWPDRALAAKSNVSVATIAETINAAIGGVRVGEYTNDDRRYDMRLRLQQGQWANPADLDQVMIRTGAGEMVPLTSVAKTQMASTLVTVTRVNRMHAITLFANNVEKVSLEKAQQDLLKICQQVLPENYKAVLTGYSQNNRETFQGIWFVFFLGFLVAYMILAAQFNSFVHPLAVLIVIPFTLTGALLSLYLTKNSLNVYSAIGLILLMGIAKKNSILLVEFFNRQRFDHDQSIRDAILIGGPIRLRPILMTSAATIAAAVPAALGLGPGAEVRIPLAIVVIGGVVISTLFSLLVVPCLYSLLTRWEGKYSPNRWKKMLES